MRPSALFAVVTIALAAFLPAVAQTPSLQITYPNGGETLQAGSNVPIRWSTDLDGAAYLTLLKGDAYYYGIGSVTLAAGEDL